MVVTIRDFVAADQPAFQRLNEEWIVRYFALEAKDREVLQSPESKILAAGGRIFLAVAADTAVGCCALLRMAAEGEFEVAKMAVTPGAQGTGLGRRLLQHAIGEARGMRARRLYLESSRVLTPALRLYESVGFRHLAPPRFTAPAYERADVYMEMML
jgi:putative acetyltransferase